MSSNVLFTTGMLTTREPGISITSDTPPGDDDAVLDIKSLFYILIGCLGVLSNGLVVFIIMKTPALRKTRMNDFILNQSAIDMVAAVLLIAHAATDRTKTDLDDTWKGDLYCRLWITRALMWGAFLSSTYNLLALTIERYMAVVHPIRHKISFTKQKALIIMIGCWIWGMFFSCCHAMPTSIVDDGRCLVVAHFPSVHVGRFVGVITFIIEYFVPIVVMVFCYSQMAVALRVKVAPTDQTNIQSEAEKKRGEKYKQASRNVIKTLALCSLMFAFCWAWNQFVFLLYSLGYRDPYNSPFYHMTVYAAFLNCCVNPFIYSLKYEQFQKSAKKIFFKIEDETNVQSVVTSVVTSQST